MYETTLYVWGNPYTISLDVYKWIMKGDTYKIKFNRVLILLNKRKREGRLF